jgi:hypothetical protein
MTYKGKFRPRNRAKYFGDPDNVTYRSLWERNAFRWCDENPSVVRWNSEEVIVPYICETDGKQHRYFIDLYLEMKSGKKYLIEIKPDSQTKPPKPVKRRTKKHLNEVLTFVKNQSKWRTADQFAKHNGMEFQVWTENTLEGMGIKTMSRPLKRAQPRNKASRKA